MNRLFSRTLIFAIIICFATNMLYAQESSRYIKTENGYLMVLRETDNVIKAIEEFAKKEQIPSANFSGIGFAGQVTFGFYDFEQKKFNPKTFERMEMGNLTGSIAWNGKNPSIHLHGMATDENFNAYGGHILALEVGTGSMEIYITVHPQKIERKVEQPLNANVLQIPLK